jgi:hypothetical protein
VIFSIGPPEDSPSPSTSSIVDRGMLNGSSIWKNFKIGDGEKIEKIENGECGNDSLCESNVEEFGN